ncbi:MAG: hypothetical protein VYC19_10605 [Pseudomonadota bacterium]|nr:hypothetical protein [Alphaproteobacteria bacterium]MEC7703193.1 hypothetical protein [Pseudomonadota bacterium]MEC9236666.1 hypothetical protein [Pseudomonadota bacterium]MEE3322886.1 hypothetical protein [Pseudomonadota bacterium]|tara:strand:+ start:14440 stop:14613 length:174 start_codon:yes stop_codon:yes gene_type:complete
MKIDFNGATTLSKLVALTAAQNEQVNANASFLQRAEQKFGDKLSNQQTATFDVRAGL